MPAPSDRIAPFGPYLFGPLRLELHAETIRNAVHVIEIGGRLVRIYDRSIIKARRAQSLHIIPLDVPRLQRQLDRVLT